MNPGTFTPKKTLKEASFYVIMEENSRNSAAGGHL